MGDLNFGTCGKLYEIFKEHCNLSMEQYEWIEDEFIYMESDIQDGIPDEDIEARVQKMDTVFDFLFETKELTLKEHSELKSLLTEVAKL